MKRAIEHWRKKGNKALMDIERPIDGHPGMRRDFVAVHMSRTDLDYLGRLIALAEKTQRSEKRG